MHAHVHLVRKALLGRINEESAENCPVQSCLPELPAAQRQRQEDNKLKASLGNLVKRCLKTKYKEGAEAVYLSVILHPIPSAMQRKKK